MAFEVRVRRFILKHEACKGTVMRNGYCTVCGVRRNAPRPDLLRSLVSAASGVLLLGAHLAARQWRP
jgi:hypothetical protein